MLALDVLFRQTGAFDKAFRGLLSTAAGMSWFFFTNCQGVQINPPCPQGEAPHMVWNADSGQGWVLPDEEGKPPGKARRLIVLPLFHVLQGESAPSRYNAGKGRWGGSFNRPTGFFSRYPYLAEKPEIPRQGDSREGNEHPFELADP